MGCSWMTGDLAIFVLAACVWRQAVTNSCGPEEDYQEGTRDTSGWLPIHHAAKRGNISVLKAWKDQMSGKEGRAACCQARAELHANTSDLKTPAHIAVEFQQVEFLHWFSMMNDWLHLSSEAGSGPCKGESMAKMPFLQSDTSGTTLLGLAIEGFQSNATFASELLEFLMRDPFIARRIETELEWNEDFGHWYMEEATRIKGNILSRVASNGFGNGSFNLSAARLLAADPSLYLMQDILTEQECAGVIDDARYFMKQGTTGGHQPVPREQLHSFMSDFDADGDGVLNQTEVRSAMLKFLSREAGSFSDSAGGRQVNMRTIAKVLQIDQNGDGEINLTSEVFDASQRDMEEFELTLAQIKKQLGGRQVRTNTVFFMPKWLSSGKRIVQKMKAAFGVPDWQIDAAQDLQVVHYTEDAHYGPHLDVPRAVTILSYLNDVPQGGNTAFPMAHVPLTRQKLENVSLTQECYESNNCCAPQCRAVNSTDCLQALHDVQDPSSPRQRFSPSEGRACLRENGTASWRLRAPGLQVPARRGTALFWYNFDRDLHGHGRELPESLHCSCDVLKGEKWATNLWLQDMDLLSSVLDYVHRVSVLRNAGQRFNMPTLAAVGDPSYERFTGGVRGTWNLRRLGQSIQRELLGIPTQTTPWAKPTFYRQCPRLQEAGSTADQFITATVHWALSMNTSWFAPRERRIERMKWDRKLKYWPGDTADDN